MSCPARVYNQSRIRQLRNQLASAAGVVEVNVGKYEPVDPSGVDVRLGEGAEQTRNGMIGAAVDKGAVSVANNQVSSIEPRPYESCVNRINILMCHNLSRLSSA
ncbi:hypothetical protein GCM10007862_08500 [Dyella lipolytica]|nr:hypothetical protein GCM10007862_08500 [Dyella lipolytica]